MIKNTNLTKQIHEEYLRELAELTQEQNDAIGAFLEGVKRRRIEDVRKYLALE